MINNAIRCYSHFLHQTPCSSGVILSLPSYTLQLPSSPLPQAPFLPASPYTSVIVALLGWPCIGDLLDIGSRCRGCILDVLKCILLLKYLLIVRKCTNKGLYYNPRPPSAITLRLLLSQPPPPLSTLPLPACLCDTKAQIGAIHKRCVRYPCPAITLRAPRHNHPIPSHPTQGHGIDDGACPGK